MLNSIPLFSAFLGGLLLVVMLTNKGALSNNRPAWRTLMLIIVLVIHAQLDAYLYYSGLSYNWVGLSFLHYPLMGGLFLLFASQLSKIKVNLRLWAFILTIYTVFRILVLIPEETSAYENYSDTIDWTDIGIMFDNLVSNVLNFVGMSLAFFKIKRLQFVVKPEKHEQLNFRLLRGLLAFQAGLYIASLAITIITLFYAEQWLTFWKIESMVSGFFFFVLAFYAIRFPIFSVHGDFRDLPASDERYARSSLAEDDISGIWSQINQLMEEEELFLNPEFRLNDLAKKIDRSVHHVSQAINQQGEGSFSDFLNGYRVEKAKRLLKSDKAQQYTILAIAYESGFNSKTAFYNAFKRHTGITPSKFIKQ